jgi:Domain of unknown function (DUF4384)
MRHVIASVYAPALVAALAAWPAAGEPFVDRPAAVVAAVEAGRPPVEELESLAEGRTVALAAGDRIVLGYVATCVLETIAGPGSVRVRASASTLEGAELVERRTIDCEGRPQAGARAGEGGATRWRSLGATAEDRVRDTLVALRVASVTAAASAAAALGRDLLGPGAACGSGRAGAQGELCRLLGGALALPDAAAVVRLNRTDGVYREGDFLVVTVEVPREIGADHHLNVVFLDEGGEVLHLLPNPRGRDPRASDGRRVVLGAEGRARRSDVRDYRVGPPFGRGAVLALLSPRPLDPVGRREAEDLGDFLASLRVALRRAQADGSSVRFAAVGLETRPR